MRTNAFAIHDEAHVFPDDGGADIVGYRIVREVASITQHRVLFRGVLRGDGARRWIGRDRLLGRHALIVDHPAPRQILGWPGNVGGMASALTSRRSRVAGVVVAASAALLLSGCEKPAPGVSVFSGTTTEWRQAVCWAFESEALEPGDCAQDLLTEASSGDVVARIPVVPGDTIGISVDPTVAEAGWTPVIGQQRLTSTPLDTTYYRFTYPDLQEVPAEGVLLQVVAGRGESTKGIWVFRLDPA